MMGPTAFLNRVTDALRRRKRKLVHPFMILACVGMVAAPEYTRWVLLACGVLVSLYVVVWTWDNTPSTDPVGIHGGRLVRSDRPAIRPWIRALAGITGALTLLPAALMVEHGDWRGVAVCLPFAGGMLYLAIRGAGNAWVEAPAAAPEALAEDARPALAAGGGPFRDIGVSSAEAERARRSAEG